ncbi:hypothetical protein BX666DRAFT_866205 [Dichotomocladium elegans]|nr:hypothetical protein BX666DRAFT_866205 [Dichotomocladium elegans]
MSSLVSSILPMDDLPFIGSKRRSLPTGSSGGGGMTTAPMIDTSRFAFQHQGGATEYHMAAHYGGGSASSTGHPIPTPSTSWTSDMSALADKIRDDNLMKPKQVVHLDKRSVSQGLKLVSIAADEYDSGNESTALGIYLTGIDKIIMALPNMTDPKTKLALRDRLTSVEERVGILNVYHRLPPQQDPKQYLQSYIYSRITTTMSSLEQQEYQTSSSDHVNRVKSFGQSIASMAVAFAIFIKQSPIPDILYFVFGYFLQVLCWLDRQYFISQRLQNLGVQCVKRLLEADEEYRLHELISESIYMLIAAGLKAVVAFKETPSRRSQPKSRW